MEEFTMLKMFLSASAIGLVVFPALNSAGIVPRNPKPAVALGFGKMGGFGLNVIGGAFLGMEWLLVGLALELFLRKFRLVWKVRVMHYWGLFLERLFLDELRNTYLKRFLISVVKEVKPL